MSTRIPTRPSMRSSNYWVQHMKMFAWWVMMPKYLLFPRCHHREYSTVPERLRRCKSGQAGTELPQYQQYLNVANEIISNNKNQIPKELWTENAEGEKIRLVRTMTDNEEGKFVADTIQEQKLRNHFSNRDFAILYRTNAQSRAFEESLRRMGIAYTMYGGISFLPAQGDQGLCGLPAGARQSKRRRSPKTNNQFPGRGIGKTTIDKIILLANENNITMWDVLQPGFKIWLPGTTLEIIENFVTMIKSFASMLNTKNAYEVAVHIGKQTNIVRELFNDKSTEGVQRYENVQELLNSIKEWVDDQQNRAQIDDDGVVMDTDAFADIPSPTDLPTLFTDSEKPKEEPAQAEEKAMQNATLAAYLQQITLLTDADEKDPHADTVKLMTIHAAKGLEFSCVFAPDWKKCFFPMP